MEKIVKPGMFGSSVAADSMRRIFDIKNEEIIYKGVTPDFVFIGDSITHIWELELYFGKKNVMLNRGIGGDTAKYIGLRADADVFQFNPKNVIYLAGTNDLLSTSPDHWWKEPGKDEDAAVNEIISEAEKFAGKCKNCRLYLCSVLPGEPCVPFDSEKYDLLVRRTNEGLKKVCGKTGAVYVDYYSAIKESGKSFSDLSHDGIHPDGECYGIMADTLKKVCMELRD